MKKFALSLFLLSTVHFIVSAQNPIKIQRPTSNIILSAEELKAPAAIQEKLLTTRKLVADNKLTFSVGLNGVTHLALSQITGEKHLNASEELQFSQSIQTHVRATNLKFQSIKLNTAGNNTEGASPAGSPTQRRFDLRTTSNVTPVKDQGASGTCWAFGAVSAFESNYRITNSLTIDGAEQQVINCSGAGDQNGGLALEALKWLVNNDRNLGEEAAIPYRGNKTACGATPATPYYALNYGVVDPSGDPSRIASVAAIKQALVKYGAISASVNATSAFQYYNMGVFNESPSNYGNPSTNHAITIIGWDDDKNAWIIKNSWGTNWGITCDYGSSRGYMYINYNANNIGRRAAWVIAKGSCPNFAIYGDILKKYSALGGASSFLGCATTSETGTPDGVGRYNHFKGGSIYWTAKTGAFEVHGDIRAKWASIGWERGYGYPTTDELPTPDGRGRFNHFTDGRSIYWTPQTGAHLIYGVIREKWASMGWERGALGYPTTDELASDRGDFKRMSKFEKGTIYWRPDLTQVVMK